MAAIVAPNGFILDPPEGFVMDNSEAQKVAVRPERQNPQLTLVPQTEQQEIEQAQKLNLEKLFGGGRGAVREKQPGETIISQENQEMLRGAMPIAGATVGSLLAPEIAVPAAVARFGPLVAKFISQAATKVPAAAGGGGAGGAIREAGQEGATPGSIAKAGLKSAGEMGAAEAAGLGLTNVISKFAPAIKLTPAIKKAKDFAKKHNIPISPEAFAKTKTAQALGFFTEKFLPARLTKDIFFREKAVVGINNIISELPKTVGKVKGNVATANIVSEQTKTALDAVSKNAKDLAGDFINTLGKGSIAVTETRAALKDALSRAKNQKVIDFIQRFQKQMVGETKGKILEENFRALGSQLKKVGSDAKLIPIIKEAIKKDFARVGGDLELLGKSSQAFSQAFALEKISPVIRQLKSGRLPPNQLTPRIFSPGNEDLVRTLKTLLPKETFDDLAAQNLSNLLIKKFSRESDRLGMGVRILDGNRMLTFLAENKNIIKETYGKETTEAIFNLARVAKVGASDIAKFDKGLGQNVFTGSLALLGGGGFQFPTTTIITTGLAPFITKSLMSTKGILKTALTTGFSGVPRAAVREGLKVGGRVAFDDSFTGF